MRRAIGNIEARLREVASEVRGGGTRRIHLLCHLAALAHEVLAGTLEHFDFSLGFTPILHITRDHKRLARRKIHSVIFREAEARTLEVRHPEGGRGSMVRSSE
jgi:hypothetical protein